MGWSREYVFDVFKDAVRHVWRNADFVLPHIKMSTDQPSTLGPGGQHVNAGLVISGHKPQAIGDSILRRGDAYRLLVSDKLLEVDHDTLWKVLVHEAVHVGVPGHGRDFRRLVLEKGGFVAGGAMETGGVIEVQKKIGARFQTVHTFAPHEEREATTWAKEQQRAEPGSRWRLQFGDVR